jgi:hypothetical protein
MLRAKEGSMINTHVSKSFISKMFRGALSPSGGPPAKINVTPTTPKATDAHTNTRVAIFCMFLLYQKLDENREGSRRVKVCIKITL